MVFCKDEDSATVSPFKFFVSVSVDDNNEDSYVS